MDAAPTARPTSRRWLRTPLVALVIWAILNAVTQILGWLDVWPESAWAFLIFLSSTTVLGIVLLLWFGFRSQAPAFLRYLVLVATVAAVALFYPLFRIDWRGAMGIEGLLFRWGTPADAVLSLENDVRAVPSDAPVSAPAEARDFPQFLGPERNAVVRGIRLARDWKSNPPQQLWRQPIGAGWSAFAAVGPWAVTHEQRGDREVVVAYELLTGKIRWTHSNAGRFKSDLGSDGPRATPTIAGGKVYALGAFGILDCLDLTTGELVWSRNVIQENGADVDTFGKAASPLVVDNWVIVSAGGTSGNSLVALNKDDGQRVWAAGNDRSSYASPTIMTLAGTRQIVVVNEDFLVGHDLASGEVLWKHDFPSKSHANAAASQPHSVGDDRVFVSKGYGLGARLVKVAREADKWTVDTLWPNSESGKPVLKTKFANVAIRDGFVWGLDDGILQCIELETGTPRWKQGRYGHGQILMVEDLILVITESTGELVLVEAKPERHSELGRIKVLDRGKTWNNLALAGPYLLVRNAAEAACYKLPLVP
jgi:outer membrane protein assembly factor BamB